MLRRAGLLSTAAVLIWGAGAPLFAQGRVSVHANVLFYGDNTEFRNPFREGETILGAALRLGAEAEISDRATLVLGVFANGRFGSDDAFDDVRPILRLTLRGKRSAFVFGSLPASPHAADAGPDLNGPHGLLPPIQRETLAFDRPYEAGLQWTFTGATLNHDVWLNWQRTNTREHRERFDGGVRGELGPGAGLAVPFQLHIVHEGGQLFATGPVADSIAAALGARLRTTFASPGGRRDAAWRLSLEAYVLASRFVPDRDSPRRSRSGAGMFARAAGERAGWRGHLLFWRGDDFVADEGDPNYLAIRRDGTRYRGVRDYAEAGVARLFRPSARLTLQASARVHRVERHYEYSYRLLGVTALDWTVR
jgi:hypothetical protein